MAVKMARNVTLCTNELFPRFIDNAFNKMGHNGLPFLKSMSPEKKTLI